MRRAALAVALLVTAGCVHYPTVMDAGGTRLRPDKGRAVVKAETAAVYFDIKSTGKYGDVIMGVYSPVARQAVLVGAAGDKLDRLEVPGSTTMSFGPDGPHEVPVQGNFRADNSLLLVDAMCRGLGVGLVPAVMMRRELQAGQLVPTLTSYRLEPRQLFAVYPSRDHLPERVRAFVRFLKARLSGAGH